MFNGQSGYVEYDSDDSKCLASTELYGTARHYGMFRDRCNLYDTGKPDELSMGLYRDFGYGLYNNLRRRNRVEYSNTEMVNARGQDSNDQLH